MVYDFLKLKTEIQKIEDWLSDEYSSIHTGRATPAILDKVMVEQYGNTQQISHVASISVEDARTLLISPWEKDTVKKIEKAISSSDLGLSASTSDSGIRVSFPELTGERKQSLVKVIKDKMEDARVSLRQEREKIWEDIQKQQKNGEMSEDDKFRAKNELQKLVDETKEKLEKMAERKEQDIMS